jgi:putative two-component system response regulator
VISRPRDDGVGGSRLAVHNGHLKDARILIVDDQAPNVLVLEEILREADEEVSLQSTVDSRQVNHLYEQFHPDLILLDLHMPYRDGFQIMEDLRPLIPLTAYVPILVLTADATPETKRRALAAGAKDFLTKPFDAAEVLLRIKNLLETRALHVELQQHNRVLEERVHERTRDLEEARFEILQRLALASEYRDDCTGRHTQRVGRLSAILAKALRLPDAQVDIIGRAAPLHDVGKIGIPDSILLKPDGLTAEETLVMRSHTTIGAQILGGSRFPLLQAAQEIALSHHERWDGAGYPRGLREEGIPLAGRIVAVADAYDAVTNHRPYRPALSVEVAWSILRDGAGAAWDRTIVEAFASLNLRPEDIVGDDQDGRNLSSANCADGVLALDRR